MNKPKIYITRSLPEESYQMLQDFAEVLVWQENRPMSREEQLSLIADCEGVMVFPEVKVNDEFLDACKKLKVVSNYGVGYDNVDAADCTARGVLVGNTPEVLSETTADLAFALIMATARRVVEMAEYVKKDMWQPKISVFENMAVDVHHATLGIIGLGRIGSQVAKRACGFNMKILYHDIERKIEVEKILDATFVSKEDLLKQSDFVSLHVPLTSDTRHLMGSAEFGIMKKTAFLINTARGPVVDQAALLEALRAGQIGGAGLDVTDPEPMRANDPLLTLPQVTILPHIGSATTATRLKMADVAVRNLYAGLNGEPMVACVNPEARGTGRNKS